MKVNRQKYIDLKKSKILISLLAGSEQEKDITLPPNCSGLGRIRHFKRFQGSNWPADPLPIDPACKKLGLLNMDMIQAQVFQIAICNWQCWYCFVPRELINGNVLHSRWVTAKELIELYLKVENRPLVIDLSGGNPELTPEWVFWMMEELIKQKLQDNVYLWSDDNLSNDFFWKYLTHNQREKISNFRNYGRVCCFKGFDPKSFVFNTKADEICYKRQFELFKRLLHLGIDLYAYATFTFPSDIDYISSMKKFIDELQKIHEHLPLRTVPLKIHPFTPVRNRLDETRKKALKNQYLAIDIWCKEIENRFPNELIKSNIADINIHKH